MAQLLSLPTPHQFLISDLLANADRCARFGFHDDAAARLYRATEAYAQYRLAAHNFPDTGKIPIAQLPSSYTRFRNPRPDAKGLVKPGLQESY